MLSRELREGDTSGHGLTRERRAEDIGKANQSMAHLFLKSKESRLSLRDDLCEQGIDELS